MERMRLLYLVALIAVFGCQLLPPERTETRSEIRYAEIPSDSVLLYALKPGLPQLKGVYQARDDGDWEEALRLLSIHLKQKAAKRYYFSWENFGTKYDHYFQTYPGKLEEHRELSADMKSMYGPDTQWKLPFKNERGEDVTAYRLRHLARQSKSFDMVLTYFADPPETENLSYWIGQMADLNAAFIAGEYDDEGNGIYEVFRAGKRTHQWLLAHNCYLSADAYSWQAQVESIRTLLHTAAQLAERGQKPRYGNHHTRGMVALFEIASQFPEFRQSDQWLELSIAGVEWHLEHEINSDGFQFERSIHYHKGDIENYFRVWQLAARNNIVLPEGFSEKFEQLFTVLLKMAQPDKLLPVFQDDTDDLHRETNEMADVMILGSILFRDETMNYFADGGISPLFFWLVSEEELKIPATIGSRKPAIGSVALDDTHYYIMRNGWEWSSEYMAITAGLSAQKPDHQHADMLGLVAYANGKEILPNYQVKYNKPDFPFWKSSWVKNVALVDSMPQTRQWKGNRGGSGFGKWLDLPEPSVNRYYFGDRFDYFAASHDGFQDLEIAYTREVVFAKEGFWIVRDNFNNPAQRPHEYIQVWQGLFTQKNEQAIYRSFDNGSSFLIQALDGSQLPRWRHGRFAEKGNAQRVQQAADSTYGMTTLLLPSETQLQTFPAGFNLLSGIPAGKPFSNVKEIEAEWFIGSPTTLYTYADYIRSTRSELSLAQPSFLMIESVTDSLRIHVLSPSSLQYRLTDLSGQILEGKTASPGETITL